jgi:hypothetical protein
MVNPHQYDITHGRDTIHVDWYGLIFSDSWSRLALTRTVDAPKSPRL